MFLRNMAEVDVKLGLRTVLSKIQEACERRSPDLQVVKPQLIAVSKTKPIELIFQTYEEGQRHFGENYVQELEEKALNEEILERCKDIRWHFIGHLQGNKVTKVLSVPNLYMIETVDSEKLANRINKKWPFYGNADTKLKVMLQVNTSGEEGKECKNSFPTIIHNLTLLAKSGVPPSDIVHLVKYVREQCTNLDLAGIMTIGQFDGSPQEDGINPDFECLKKCREDICQNLGLDWTTIGLSMGMSNDFEQAIVVGSTNVRVGSLIFGYRPPKDVPGN